MEREILDKAIKQARETLATLESLRAALVLPSDPRDVPEVDLTHLELETSRVVSRVFLHYSYSDNPEHDNAATIDRWHRAKGWNGIGYHFFIRKSGQIEAGRDLDLIPAAQAGHNSYTIAICLHGKAEFPTAAQVRAMRALCVALDGLYEVSFHGHVEVGNTSCPGDLDYIGILELNESGKMRRGTI